MSINTIHRLDKIVLPSSVEFAVLKNARWSAGISSFLENPAGGTYPMFRANQIQKPMITFTTTQLDVLLGTIGPGGAAVSTISTYFKLGATTGNVARGTASHQKIVVSQSCVYWSNIRLTDKGMGEAQVMIVPIYDGTNDPFVYTGSVALSGTLVAGNFFGAGPVEINGSAIPGISEITIDAGVKIVQLADNSEEFDTFVGIEEGRPSITIKTLELVNWSTLGLRGTVLDGTNGIVCYGRKFAPSASRVSNATAAHLKFQGLNGTCIPVESAGDGRSPMSDTLKVELVTLTAETNPLTCSTGQAIT